MEFTPNSINVRQLLKRFSTFNIPVFQRDYSWEEHYYGDFLKDMLQCITYDQSEDILKISNYFIGTMVFSGKDKDLTIDVVDGQQRLTVITILFSVIAQKFKEVNEESLAKAMFTYIKGNDDDGEPIVRLHSDTSYPYLDAVVQSYDKISKPDISSEEEEHIKSTYEYFEGRLSEPKIRKDYPQFSNVSYIAILKAIRDQILDTTLISIVTTDKKQAYMIFEILNAKGKSLASIDLIKNIIFEVFHNDDNALLPIANTSWENIKDTLRTRNNNIGLATFYRHYWISKYKKVTSTKLYDSFKEEIVRDNISDEEKKEIYMSFLKDLEKESKTYIRIASPRIDDYNNMKQYNWLVQSMTVFNNTFNLMQSRIFFLALLDAKERGVLSMKDCKNAVTYLENFVYAYTAISKKPANIYESRFSKFAINLRKSNNTKDAKNVINTYLYEAFKDKEISLSEFKENFITLSYSKKYSTSNMITKYTLNKICSYNDKRETFYDDASIEHILNENINEEITLNIGNLICLEESINNRLSQVENYVDKKSEYQKSKYYEVKIFVNKYDDFSREDVLPRANDLAEYYYNNIICLSRPKI